MEQQEQQQGQQNQAIKQLVAYVDNNALERCRKKVLKKLAEAEEPEEMDKYLSILEKIECLKGRCEENKEGKDFKGIWVNTKEDFEALRGAILGNLTYEDWQLIRMLFKVKVIERLLGGE